MPETLIVIPTYNEIDNVRAVAKAVLAAVPHAHVLFVDDNSPDGTGAAIDALAAEDPEQRIQGLHREKKVGLGPAYVAGFTYALEKGYDLIVQMDADLSHDPADIPRLLAAVESHDAAVGSRYMGGHLRVVDWPLARLILSKGASHYTRWVTGLPVADPTAGFGCFRREVLQHIDPETLVSSGYSFQVELKYRAWMAGFSLTEIPITFHDRRSGQSKMESSIVTEAMGLIWRIARTNRFRRSPAHPPHPNSAAKKGTT